MKIHILYTFQDNPWGGGNQFLKALKKQFLINDVYCQNPTDAGVILFNSHHQIKSILILKKKYSDKIFIHRLDGPIFKLRERHFFWISLFSGLTNQFPMVPFFNPIIVKKMYPIRIENATLFYGNS